VHILPERFVKIRHYGILSNRNKKIKIKKCKDLLEYKSTFRNKEKQQENDYKCPICNKGIIKKIQIILPYKLAPPRKAV